MKKFKNIFILFSVFMMLFTNISFGTENVNFKSMIKSEEGSLFEKIIAETIGGIAQTVYNFATSDSLGIGFKNYDELIFNNNLQNDSYSPFSIETWNKILEWYRAFSIISGSLIFIGIIILSYKLMLAGANTTRKNEVKDSLIRLLFGGCAIALAPLFIRFLLFINNSLVHILLNMANGGLNGLLGNEMLSSIRTGNCITTALVISMFIYLFVKLNIKFIVREFTLIVFTIFTPIVAGLWIINKNVTAAAIWAGQILINVFMQFIYCFLFLLYLSFLPSTAGWAVSLIWAMMILPLADTLQNCLQNLTSRIAGIDNNEMATRALGMGTAFGYSLSAIKNQFSTGNVPSNIENTSSGTGLFGGIMSKAKNTINPTMNLSNETDYNGNKNPIRDVISNNKEMNKTPIQPRFDPNNKSKIFKLANLGMKATGTYLRTGARLTEGNYKTSDNIYNQNKNYNNFNTSEYQNKLSMLKENEKSDDKNE